MKCYFLMLIFFHLHLKNFSWAFSTKAFVSKIPSKIPYNDTGLVLQRYVTFELYTRDNPYIVQKLKVDDSRTLKRSSFNSIHPTTFVTHGWKSSCSEAVCQLIQRGFLKHRAYNVIRVDWRPIAMLQYTDAASRLQIIGRYVARMINFLINEGANPKNITLVGHSLGAHIMGIAGFFAENRVSHIVGLDPAMPGFVNHGPDGRITKLDADLVEIIHTCAGVLGFNYSIGHVDFYPNGGGPSQPGCYTYACAHKRSYYFYAESLSMPMDWYAVKCSSNTKFLAGRCDNNIKVSFPRWFPDLSKPEGDYYLRTSPAHPYGLGLSGTRPANTTGSSLF